MYNLSIHPYIQYVGSLLLLFTFCHTLTHCTCTIRSFIQWLSLKMIIKIINRKGRSHHNSLGCFILWQWRRGSWDQWRKVSPLCRSHHRHRHHRFYLEPGRKKRSINTTAGGQHTTTALKITVQDKMQTYIGFTMSVLGVADGGVVDTIFRISLHTEDNTAAQ